MDGQGVLRRLSTTQYAHPEHPLLDVTLRNQTAEDPERGRHADIWLPTTPARLGHVDINRRLFHRAVRLRMALVFIRGKLVRENVSEDGGCTV